MSFAHIREPRGVYPERGPDWDDLKLFLQVCRSGSFRAAANLSGQAHNTIARRMSQLEQHYGRVFLRRQPQGVEITAEGLLLQREAARIQMQLEGLGQDLRRLAQEGAGPVRAEVEEAIAQLWLMPRLPAFRAQEPAAEVEMRAVRLPGPVMGDGIDLSIDWRMPPQGGAIVRRIGRMHFVPAASKTYLAARAGESAAHVVVQSGGEGDLPRLVDVLDLPAHTPVLSSLSAEATMNALEHGAGIGWLPDFAVASHDVLVRLGATGVSRDIYLSFHPDSGRIERVRRFIDWCVTQFDARQSWFRDVPAPSSGVA